MGNIHVLSATYSHVKYTGDPDGTANAIKTQGGLDIVFSFLQSL